MPKELSADQIQDLLKFKGAQALKHETKIKSAFTLDQYEEIARAFQAGEDSTVLVFKDKIREYKIIRSVKKGEEWIIVSPVEGFVPMGCYRSERLADLSKGE